MAFAFFRRAPEETPQDIAETARWLEREFATTEGYRFSGDCDTSLLGTCMGVLAHELFGGFAHLSDARRARLTETLLEHQSPKTGMFRDPAHPDSLLFGLRKFTPLYVEWQETYFALHALHALGTRPRYPLRFVEPFCERALLEVWLRGLSFDDFWFSSNYLMFLLCFLIDAQGPASPAAHVLLDRLDERQDPKTGFWGTDQGATLFNGMAGAFHLFGYYLYLERPIAHAGVALESTLTLQERSGLFGGVGGGPCEDLDAVDILVKLTPASADQERRIRQALERCIGGLRTCRLAGGGYAWWPPRARLKHQLITYSGLPNLRTRTERGDIWSAWFRPLTLALARARLEQPIGWDARFRGLPLLGWHPAHRL